MSEVVMLVGSPASGKSNEAKKYTNIGYIHISRDLSGGKVEDLLPSFKGGLGKNNIILDNTFPTAQSRKPFIEAAKDAGVDIKCKFMSTSTEDCSINALNRMWDRYGKLFLHPEDLKEVKHDPNMFPIAALFKYRKDFQEPTTAEGFHSVEKVSFVRKDWGGVNLGLILDYDDTLRTLNSTAKFKFPAYTSEIVILKNRKEKLHWYRNHGYHLLGASNQSGIHKGSITKKQAIDCFNYTNQQLNADIDYMYCPHQSSPPCCYCRKPQSGMGVYLVRKYDLNPKKTIFVGDQTSDKTFAKRLGFQFFTPEEFFN